MRPENENNRNLIIDRGSNKENNFREINENEKNMKYQNCFCEQTTHKKKV